MFNAVRGGKKNPNPLAHPNPLTNCPPKPTYLINGQMGVSPIRPNLIGSNWALIGLLIGHQQKAQTRKKNKKKFLRGFGHFGGSKGISVFFLSFNCFFIIL